MKYVAVIDTNVIVSGLLKKDSNPGKILQYVKNDVIIPVYDSLILSEYMEVMVREKFGFKQRYIDQVLNLIQQKGRVLNPTTTNEIFKDKSDVKFYEIVLTARKARTSYLITGNLKHFPQKVFVVDPTQMIEIIEGK